MTKPAPVDQALEWMLHQHRHPTRSWRGLCQSSVRRAYGLPAWATSARKAYEATPSSEMHHAHSKRLDEIPRGAILYGLLNHTYGHAWLYAGHGRAWTVDYIRRGGIDKVAAMLSHWTGKQGVHWSLWTPYGMIDTE